MNSRTSHFFVWTIKTPGRAEPENERLFGLVAMQSCILEPLAIDNKRMGVKAGTSWIVA